MLRSIFRMRSLFLSLLCMLCMTTGYAQDVSDACSTTLEEVLTQMPLRMSKYNCEDNMARVDFARSDTPQSIQFNLNTLPVNENRLFYGLASYYNVLHFFLFYQENIETVSKNQKVLMNETDWFAVAGRFEVVLYKAPGAIVEIKDQELVFTWPSDMPRNLTISIQPKTNLAEINPEWKDLRYQHLWGWLAGISKAIEWSMVTIYTYMVSDWGWVIVFFAVLLKILLLPVSWLTVRLQRQASEYQSILAPQVKEIKAKYDGEEAHKRIMEAHKALNITPFYTLKPMVGALIQIPIFTAIFNALGEMYQLNGASFLWIDNLAYPDAVASLPFFVPFFGDTLNVLPIVMTIVTIISTVIFQNRYALPALVKRQKRNLYFMAFAFFVLFYPFPAAMVLYWALSNLLHAFQQQLLK